MPTRPFAVPFAAGAAFALAYVVACGGIPGAEGEGPDAGGSASVRVVEVACDKSFKQGDNTYRYAMVQLEEGESPAATSVIACGKTCVGAPGGCSPMCHDGFPCEGEPWPEPTCEQVTSHYTETQVIVHCGWTRPTDGVERGVVYSTARIAMTR